MQGFGFALVVHSSLPATVLGLALGSSSLSAWLFVPQDGSMPQELLRWLWVATWLGSLVWVSRHVWTASCVRLSSADRIFAVPGYDSLLVDQSLALARWREEPDEYTYADEQVC